MQFNSSSFLENEIQTTTGKTLAPSAPKQRSALGGLSLNAGGKTSSSSLSSSSAVHSSYSDDIEFCSTTSSALPFSSNAAEELFGKSSSVMSMKKLRSLGTSIAASTSLPTLKLSKSEVDESSLSSMKMNHFNPKANITSGGYKPSSFAVYEEDVVDDNAAQVEEVNHHNKVVVKEEEWTFKEFDE